MCVVSLSVPVLRFPNKVMMDFEEAKGFLMIIGGLI